MDIKIHCHYDELLDIKAIQPDPANRNKHDKGQIEQLAKIIEYQGWRWPLVINKETGILRAGHGRWAAAKKLKLKAVPVVYQEFKDSDQDYAFMVSDNAIGQQAEIDMAGINLDLENLGPDFDLDWLGIKDFKLDAFEKELGDEEETPEPPKDSKVVKGDVYILGDHRLMCGDSTVITDVEKLMNGEKADMVFTDPPYGMNLDTDYTSLKSKRMANKFERVVNDDKDFDPSFILSIFDYCSEIFLWGFDYYAQKMPYGTPIVWDKRNENENLDKMYGSLFELCWSKNKHKREIARITWAGCFGHNKNDDGHKKVHPTMKPIKLIEWFFNKYSKQNELVIDIFGGSGSTLIACEKTNRKCYMMELDEYYCHVILERWQKYTGRKAIREDGKLWDDIKEGK